MASSTSRGWNLQAPWQVGVASLVVLGVALLAHQLGPERYPADEERAITFGVVVAIIAGVVVIADIALGRAWRGLAWIGFAGAWALAALAVSGPDPSPVWLGAALAYFSVLGSVARRDGWRISAVRIALLLVLATVIGFAIWAAVVGGGLSTVGE